MSSYLTCLVVLCTRSTGFYHSRFSWWWLVCVGFLGYWGGCRRFGHRWRDLYWVSCGCLWCNVLTVLLHSSSGCRSLSCELCRGPRSRCSHTYGKITACWNILSIVRCWSGWIWAGRQVCYRWGVSGLEDCGVMCRFCRWVGGCAEGCGCDIWFMRRGFGWVCLRCDRNHATFERLSRALRLCRLDGDIGNCGCSWDGWGQKITYIWGRRFSPYLHYQLAVRCCFTFTTYHTPVLSVAPSPLDSVEVLSSACVVCEECVTVSVLDSNVGSAVNP